MGEQLLLKRNECGVDLAQRSRHRELRHLAGQRVNKDLATCRIRAARHRNALPLPRYEVDQFAFSAHVRPSSHVLAHVLDEDVRQGLDDSVLLVLRKALPSPHSATERDRCPVRSIDRDRKRLRSGFFITHRSPPGTIGDVDVLALPPFIQLPVDWALLGNAVHAFLAADRPDLDSDERLAMASRLLEHWSVQGVVRAEDLLAVSDRLRGWAARRFPGATWHREWPVRVRQDNGTELVGDADLALEDGDAFVFVDHKCVGGTQDEALAACSGYAGQIRTYAGAIAAATGKRMAGCFVHLVAQGVMAALTHRPH